jgi:general secretion pathway protein L
VPAPALRVLSGTRPIPVLAEVDGGYRVIRNAMGGARPAAPGDGAVLPREDALAALAAAARASGTRQAGIRLAEASCFSRSVELPAAARGDFRQILNFDLERATPFRLQDVYTAHVVEGLAPGKGRLRLRQLVAKREPVDALIADVKAAGLDVAFVDCWRVTPADGLAMDFLQRSADGNRLVTLPRALAALALLLLVAVAYVTLSKYESALADVQARVAQVRAEAAGIRQQLDRSSMALEDLKRLQRQKMQQLPAIAILEEVSRLLPDTVWLNELRIEGDTLDIAGLAKSGATVLPLFQESSLFTDAALTAPVTLDPREDKERFSLRARIRQPVARSAEAKERP